MNRRGATLIETIVYTALVTILSGSALTLVVNMHAAQKFTSTAPALQREATDLAVDTAALIRKAPLCLVASGCAGVSDSAFASAGAASAVVYTTPAGGTRTCAAVASTGSTATMTFSYLVNSGLTYGMAGDPAAATWVSSVSSSALPGVIAVRVVSTVTQSGLTATGRAEVRLRNSPRKLRSTD